jgi:hypothetical protein
MLHDDFLQQAVMAQGLDGDGDQNIGRALIDCALVVYDLFDPPSWLRPVLELRGEDGNTPPEQQWGTVLKLGA